MKTLASNGKNLMQKLLIINYCRLHSGVWLTVDSRPFFFWNWHQSCLTSSE